MKFCLKRCLPLISQRQHPPSKMPAAFAAARAEMLMVQGGTCFGCIKTSLKHGKTPLVIHHIRVLSLCHRLPRCHLNIGFH